MLENQATATFILEGEAKTAISNIVQVSVEPVEAIRLVEPQGRLTQAGREIFFDHTITNIGNLTSRITASIENAQGNDFDFENFNIELFQAIAGKSALNNTKASTLEFALAPGEEISIRLSARVPEIVSVGEQASVDINLITAFQQIRVSNRDSVTILAGTEMVLSKAVISPNPQPGEELLYRLDGENTGDVAALGIQGVVDGISERVVLIRDQIPRNTEFSRFISFSEGRPLYHVFGESELSFRSKPPEDLSTVNEIALGIPTVSVGGVFSFEFAVRILDHASGTIENAASVTFDDGLGERFVVSASNEVLTPLSTQNTVSIFYYTNDSFTQQTQAGRLAQPAFVEALAASCNVDAATVDTVQIRIESMLTGDVESFRGIEDGFNTGRFQILPSVPTADISLFPVEAGNERMETTTDDELLATIQECSNNVVAQAVLYMDPVAVLFDSRTNQPISGAEITIIDVTGAGNGGNAGAPATVFNADMTEELSSTFSTDATGSYRFPLLLPSSYRIEVTPPNEYKFPSELALNQLPGGRFVNLQASYGQTFDIVGIPRPANWDTPIDLNANGLIELEKIADRQEVELGSFVNYSLDISNPSQSNISDVFVTDRIPFGFLYQEGSAQVDKVAIADPTVNRRDLQFNIGTLQAQSSVKLTYRLKAGVASLNSEGLNIAQVGSNDPFNVTSNVARARVEVIGGVFSDESYVVGKVYYDKNKNRMQDADEPGIPGIHLILQNGNYVITDGEGKYSFFGLSPRKHVLKIDETTIPKGGRLEVLDNRHADDPSSRFVDLKKGEIHKADFAICACDGPVEDEIQSRRKKAREFNSDEIEAGLNRRLTTQDQRHRPDQTTLPTSGILDQRERVSYQSIDTLKKEASQLGEPVNMLDNAPEKKTLDWLPIEEMLAYVNNDFGFLELRDGDTLKTSQLAVRLKGKTGSLFRLIVNTDTVGQKRVGQKSTLNDKEAWEFVGVKFKGGKNKLIAQMVDPFGNVREERKIMIIAPGELATIQILIPEEGTAADGVSEASVRVRLLDKEGVPVTHRIPVTLDIDYGKWQLEDLNEKEPGTQIFIQDGETEIKVLAPESAGKGTIRIQAGKVEAEKTISYIPDLRPLIAAGIIEGTLRFNSIIGIEPPNGSSGFEKELQALSYENGDFQADARASFYLKGQVLGKYLLTAQYDSEKEEEGFFRDIQPDQFYPVYGDASIKGFDAQSSGRLFVKLERNRSYALIGDFIAQDQHPARSLGAYNRTQSGARLHYETDRIKANAFGSQLTSNIITEEFSGLGISGPYILKSENILLNSEIVEIITRDRNQPDVIVSIDRMSRFRDYTIEPFTGHLLFKFPVASLDENLNPRFIRITYEVENGGDSYFLLGADAQVKVSDQIELGGSVINDNNPQNEYNLGSINATVKVGANTKVIGEAAVSDDEILGTGNAVRGEIQHQGSVIQGRIYAGKSSDEFSNRFATLGAGRTEMGARGSARIGQKTALTVQALHSRNDTSGALRQGVLLAAQRQLNHYLQLELGGRYSRQSGNNNFRDVDNLSARSKLSGRVPGLQGSEFYGEYEQEVSNTDRKILAIGGEQSIARRGRVYARHEFISSLSGQFGVNGREEQNNTIFGVDAKYMKNGNVYSEYRMRDAVDGRNAQAAIGLRNKFAVSEGLDVNASAERVFSVAGRAVNEGTALALAVAYTAQPNWKATTRGEVRFSPNSNTYLHSVGYGHKLSKDWTFLVKNILAYTTRDNSSARLLERAQIGFAYRDLLTSRWNSLFRYEYKVEKNSGFREGVARQAHIISTHTNVQINEKTVLSTRIAGKHAREEFQDVSETADMGLVQARLIYDLTRKWDVGVMASTLTELDLSAQTYGAGAEVGRIVAKNLRLAVGYNVFGYREQDMTASEFTDHGVYVNMSYKFDERSILRLFKQKPQQPELYFLCEEECTIIKAKTFDFPIMQPSALPIAEVFPHELNSIIFLPAQIHFGLDKSDINAKSAQMLNQIVKYMVEKNETKLLVAGHTDSRASNAYNKALSQRRTESTTAYLISSGLDLVAIEQRSFSKDSLLVQEQHITHESENRRVEFGLDPKAPEVEFLDQYEDLQIERQAEHSKNWEFLYHAELNAVPDRVWFDQHSFFISTISALSLDRVVLLMNKDTKLHLTLRAQTGEAFHNKLQKDRIAKLRSHLIDAGIDSTRITKKTSAIPEDSRTNDFSAEARRAIYLDFEPASVVTIVEQKDPIEGWASNEVPKSVVRMVQIQRFRNDIRLLSQGFDPNIVPSSVHFAFAAANLDHRTRGVLARVGNYLMNHPEVRLELIGRSDSETRFELNEYWAQRRSEAVKQYLIDWGIAEERIQMGTTITSPKQKEETEMDKAKNRRVDFIYREVLKMQIIEQLYDLKPRTGSLEKPE